MDDRRVEMIGPAGNVMVPIEDIPRGLANGFTFRWPKDAQEFEEVRRALEAQAQAREDAEFESFPPVVEWTGGAQVFVVEHGTYSDRHVAAVFSSEELAQRWIGDRRRADLRTDDDAAWCCHDDEFRITEFPLNPTRRELPQGHVVWRAEMWRDGKVEHAARTRIKLFDPHVYPDSFLGGGRERVFFVVARDREHAVKVANERRAQLIANNEWPPASNEAF